MQVILLERVVNLGSLGEVVKVRNGYARNFLIPQGIARRATDEALKEFEERRAELEKAQADREAAAKSVAERMEGLSVEVSEKAGVDGRLFGSVTSQVIAGALREKGFEVDKSMVRLAEGPLKNVGEHKVSVAFHGDVSVEITVVVSAATV
ncbi:MAG: 50S ribosomal protein L9 [Burkholderiales bacterium]|nr:MAG: 50S ribosomal protein L9 [Burkholderiales bacterium]